MWAEIIWAVLLLVSPETPMAAKTLQLNRRRMLEVGLVHMSGNWYWLLAVVPGFSHSSRLGRAAFHGGLGSAIQKCKSRNYKAL